MFRHLLWVLAAAVAPAQDAKAPPPTDPDLRAELLRRAKADADARFALLAWTKKHGTDPTALPADLKAESAKLTAAVAAVDKENTARLTELIDKGGWPTITRVGKDGSHSAWYLAQHADANPKFQRRCLDRMAKLPAAEVSPTFVAYLTDRVLLAEGKKQVYGTQFTSAGGKWEPRPLEDPAQVDERRKAVGLKPLAEYARELGTLYGPAGKK